MSVVIRCQTPSGSYRFHAATLSPSTPAQPYEDKRCAGGLRAVGWLLRAQSEFKSPGGISPILVQVPFARRQAVSGATSANRTLTAVQFLGAILRLPRRLSFLHRALQPAKQARDGLTNVFQVLFGLLVAHEQQRSRKGMSWVASVVSRVTKCL